MTGYEEILTDPSYAAQIITFTFPHIGIVGVNDEDIEVVNRCGGFGRDRRHHARRHWRARQIFALTGGSTAGSKRAGSLALRAIDTRALTTLIRERGMPNAVIAHSPDGAFDLDALRAKAAAWPGIDGMDLVPAVGSTQRYDWDETSWTLEDGYSRARGDAVSHRRDRLRDQAQHPEAPQRLSAAR